MLGTMLYNQVTKEETVAAFMCKMDKPWLRPNEVRVEIRWGHALWLRRNHRMRVSEATAPVSANGVLTIRFPRSNYSQQARLRD
ncbi:hypothetical protein ACJRO7_019484 [Eucalyptus globulus]|uniref:Uncharacterized protein n=1 Tax=Eucalyptus globulus TaxID=34317 RepID=A0ABD3KIP6_EUCGL